MTIPVPPDAHLFLSHLGKPLNTIDPLIFSHADDPDFTVPDHSPLGAILFRSLGFSLSFCPPDFYHMNDALAGQHPIITNVQLYSGDENFGHTRYCRALPLDLDFDDNREAVLRKLGPSAWRFPFVPPFTLERWDLSDRWILVAYSENLKGISTIQVGLSQNKPKATVLPKILQPDMRCVQAMFGRSAQAVASEPCFQGIDFSEVPNGPMCDDSFEIDALPTNGVEIYFDAAHDRDANVLSGIRYIRKGIYWSSGFEGELPKGIRFEDRPETIVAKVGEYPVTGVANCLSGYYLWNLPEFLLQISFSTMEQRINRIFVAMHPYYPPALLESPMLGQPSENFPQVSFGDSSPN
ncbi:hypothetical protein LXA47_19430 [Massilia sp. P8910]|uniref:hypothetical protein n=1 Tax=Massilia antarctica TaxID=2765360 RepID=UPI001E2F7D73|nr:hypothetical protein [Massilia antarctica]MCE3605760.1 hypothetical protein [Massilia antarctica]